MLRIDAATKFSAAHSALRPWSASHTAAGAGSLRRRVGLLGALLLAVALSADPRVDQVAAVTDAGAIEDAVDAGVVATEAGRVRASHPLLAAAAQRHSRARERRRLDQSEVRVVAVAVPPAAWALAAWKLALRIAFAKHALGEAARP